jgi:hypothetical protein
MRAAQNGKWHVLCLYLVKRNVAPPKVGYSELYFKIYFSHEEI